MTRQSLPKLQPKGLRNLRAYQLAKRLGHLIRKVTANFPKSEFRLIGQMRGASVSAFGNIAEGYGRGNPGDYVRFCEIARGSLCELSGYIEFCHEENMLKPDEETQLFDSYNHTWNTLGALIRSLKEKKQDGSWDRSYKTIKDDEEVYNVEPSDQSSNSSTLLRTNPLDFQPSDYPDFPDKDNLPGEESNA